MFMRVDLVQLTSFQRLATQLKNLNVPFTDDFHSAAKESDHLVDAIFGTPASIAVNILKI
jgi:hypothetical protein